MNIEKFKSLVPIPVGAKETPSMEEWDRLKARGLFFPKDFQDYISNYGTGMLARFFNIWNPLSSIPGVNWLSQKNATIKSLEEVIEADPEAYIHWQFHPQRRGLLPCGATSNGDIIFWVAEGQPNSWNVAVSSMDPELECFEEGLLSLLYNSLTVPNYSDRFGDLSQSPKTFVPLNL